MIILQTKTDFTGSRIIEYGRIIRDHKGMKIEKFVASYEGTELKLYNSYDHPQVFNCPTYMDALNTILSL